MDNKTKAIIDAAKKVEMSYEDIHVLREMEQLIDDEMLAMSLAYAFGKMRGMTEYVEER